MTLILELPDEEEAALHAKAKAEGLSAEQWARQLLRHVLTSAGATPLLPDRIREIWADLPDAERAKLPVDAASQHDHYIYGVPKAER